jgi:exodeoxyribonuclease VII large subunit
MSKEDQDLFASAFDTKRERHVLTISQITQDIKLILESSFSDIWVEGEVSNFKSHASGHFYFSLKDDSAVLSSVMFARANKDVKFKLENGLKVVCFGKISVYGPYGQYQIIIEKIEPKGIGSLQLALEQLKVKLEKEGLFSPEHKRQLPYLPGKIGIVTSESGAAIKDILKVLDRRFSGLAVVIRSAQVQGEAAGKDIAQGIQDLNAYNETLAKDDRIEVMIVGRGGGSIEDLWAFNEEIVARAIYNSMIPVISAVGHERDWTISDLVADVRAATPSVAAELVIPRKEDLLDRVESLFEMLRGAFSDIARNFQEELENLLHHLKSGVERIFERSAGKLDTFRHKLTLLNPAAQIEDYQLKLLDLARQIYVRAGHFLELRQAQFSTAVEKLSSLSPLNILGRGYSITFRVSDAAVIKDAAGLKAGESIRTRLHKGEIISTVKEVMKNGGSQI